jgi:hypothetical protein
LALLQITKFSLSANRRQRKKEKFLCGIDFKSAGNHKLRIAWLFLHPVIPDFSFRVQFLIGRPAAQIRLNSESAKAPESPDWTFRGLCTF